MQLREAGSEEFSNRRVKEIPGDREEKKKDDAKLSLRIRGTNLGMHDISLGSKSSLSDQRDRGRKKSWTVGRKEKPI